MCIPGGIDVPGAELVHRVHDLAPDPTTLVVVNCAGRTRSIIGAQSLINAGIANPVVALENGTMGWTLAGYPLEHGQERTAPPLSAAGRGRAQAAAARVGARFGVRTIDRATLERWRAEAEQRTLYLCDVRSPEEYRAGHLPGARCTPGGQLVQATDSWLGTHGARVVLIDDDGVRATLTASWLLQLGRWEVFVLADGLGDDLTPRRGADRGTWARGPPGRGRRSMSGTWPRSSRGARSRSSISPTAALSAPVICRAPGIWCAGGSREDWPRSGPAPAYVLTSPDGILARLAVAEAARLAEATPVRWLDGGTAAWRAAGLPLESGAERIAPDPDDVYLRPYDLPPERIEQAMRDYLRWETALVPEVERDGTLRFARPG